ncbi:MAG: hypothetical protein IT338_10030 [Thermomicrobiales bacterium]|nr:hypothetical protein [Thermomicrobiales bacterium]
MQSETILRRVALGCAIFMLFGPLGGRTMWVKANGSSTTDAGFYNAAAVFSGVVALLALTVALNMRPRVVVPALTALAAAAAFGLSVYVSGLYVWARWQGEIWFYGAGWFAEDPGPKWMVSLPWGPPYFALAALAGALASLALAVTWLWRPRGDPDGGSGSRALDFPQ